MTKYCLISVAALGLLSSVICRADIVVNYGPPPDCPPCDTGVSGQPDLLNPGPAGAAQDFTLLSSIDLTGITFWTYEEPGTWDLPVQWSIDDASLNTVASGTSPTTDTPLLAPVLGQMGFDLQLSMISVDLGGPVQIDNPGTYSLNLQFILPSDPSDTLFYWAQGTNDHVAFQLTDESNAPIVPEPSYMWFSAGGLGILMAYRIRKKR